MIVKDDIFSPDKTLSQAGDKIMSEALECSEETFKCRDNHYQTSVALSQVRHRCSLVQIAIQSTPVSCIAPDIVTCQMSPANTLIDGGAS